MVIEKVKKETVVSCRISDVISNQIEKIIKKTGENKASFIRKAINTYIFMKKDIKPIILWARNEFAYSLNCMDDSQIKGLADLSYKNGIESLPYLFRSLEENTKISDEFDISKIPIQIFLNTFLKFTNSPELLNFFDSSDFKWIEKYRKRLQIIINHSINENFSKFMKILIENYLKSYKYSLTKEILLEDLIVLEFTKKNPK